MQRLIRRERPDVTLWYHQALRLVVLVPRAPTPGSSAPTAAAPGCRRAPAALPRDGDLVAEPPLPGTSGLRGGAAGGAAAGAVVRRHARGGPRGRRAAARTAAPRRAAAAAADRLDAASPSAPSASARCARTRCATTGVETHLLRDPKVIVEHFTASTRSPRVQHLRRQRARRELGERPGVCAHFVVDRDGTIHQLVSLRFMCRHTVGLNHIAIGIEHVGHERRRRSWATAASSTPRCG